MDRMYPRSFADIYGYRPIMNDGLNDAASTRSGGDYPL
jgi:hypothetical protein